MKTKDPLTRLKTALPCLLALSAVIARGVTYEEIVRAQRLRLQKPDTYKEELAKERAAKTPAAGSASADRLSKEMFKVGGSVFWPHYLGQGTVYTRGVADMPLAENSDRIAKYMKAMPA